MTNQQFIFGPHITSVTLRRIILSGGFVAPQWNEKYKNLHKCLCVKPLDLKFSYNTINIYSKKMNLNSKLFDINQNGRWRHSTDHCDGITFHFSMKQPKIQSFHKLAINGWSIGTEFRFLSTITKKSTIRLFESTLPHIIRCQRRLTEKREFDLFIFVFFLQLKHTYELNINYEPDQQSHESIEIKKE